MSTVTPKEVMFSVDIAVPSEHKPGEPGAAGAPAAAGMLFSFSRTNIRVSYYLLK